MDNDDNLNNMPSEQDENTPKDDIPLWLQGLEDLEGVEDTNPIEMTESVKDEWVKELPEELQDISRDLVNEERTPQSELPEWLREASEDEPLAHTESPPEEAESLEAPIPIYSEADMSESAEDGQDLVELESSQISIEHEINEIIPPDLPIDHEFIEIPTHDEEEPQDQETYKDIENGDELPQWLQEMIAEPAESDAERADIGAEALSESDALATIQPPSIEEELSQEIEDHFEETPASEVELTEQEAELTVIELSDEITNEEETKPVEIQPILEDKPDDQVDEDYTEVAETVEQVQSLEFAKTQFEQGNIEKAIEIIAALEVGPDYMQYLDEMERTLIDEVNSTAKDNSDAWEFLGDIALLKKKPEEAFDAYKQAIQLLVAEKKDTDGTD